MSQILCVCEGTDLEWELSNHVLCALNTCQAVKIRVALARSSLANKIFEAQNRKDTEIVFTGLAFELTHLNP